MNLVYLTAGGGTINAVPIVIITLCISLTSLAFGFYQYVKKTGKEDVKEARVQVGQDVSRMTEVMIKLDHIQLDTTDIKNEMKGVKQEMNVFRDRLTRNEMKVDSAHQRLDDYFKKVGEPTRADWIGAKKAEGAQL